MIHDPAIGCREQIRCQICYADPLGVCAVHHGVVIESSAGLPKLHLPSPRRMAIDTDNNTVVVVTRTWPMKLALVELANVVGYRPM